MPSSGKTGRENKNPVRQARRDFSTLDDHSLVSFALGHKNPTALTKNDRSLYLELKRRNLYDTQVKPAFEKATIIHRPYESTPDEALLEKAQRFLGRMELSEQDPELRAELEQRALWDMALPKRRRRWEEEEVREVALGYNSRMELSRGHPAAYYWATQLEIIDDLFDGDGLLTQDASARRIWTLDKIVEKAQLCKSRSEFHKRFPGAYAAARSNDILDEVCAHMGRFRHRKTPSAMSNLELWQEAAQYSSPNAFLRGNRSAYNQIVRRGLFQQIAKELGWVV